MHTGKKWIPQWSGVVFRTLYFVDACTSLFLLFQVRWWLEGNTKWWRRTWQWVMASYTRWTPLWSLPHFHDRRLTDKKNTTQRKSEHLCPLYCLSNLIAEFHGILDLIATAHNTNTLKCHYFSCFFFYCCIFL